MRKKLIYTALSIWQNYKRLPDIIINLVLIPNIEWEAFVNSIYLLKY